MKKAILLVALLTLVAFVSGVLAQGKPAPAPAKAATTPAPAAAPAKLENFSGDIKNVNAAAKTIVVVKAKEEKTFIIDDGTKIVKGKDTLKSADLKTGMNVVIEFKKDGDKMIAVAIKVAAPKGK